MQTKLKICKLYLLLCLGLSTNASPVLYGLKTTPSNYQQDRSSFHHESSYSSQPSYENIEIKSTSKSSSLGDEILKNTPGITTTFKDQNGNIVTQVKKETFNSDNGQSAHAFEFQESKQLPNGYSKSFKKEFSSSSITGSQPTIFIQTPLNIDKYYNSDKLINGQHLENYQGSSISGNSDYVGIKSNLKATVEQSNVPGITTTFRDQNGNIVTQVKKEIVNNDNGQNSHVVEFEETKQLPNGYSKSFKKEYSSSSVSGSQPTTFIQTPSNVDKYYNSEKLTNGHSTTFGQSLQNHQGQSVYDNTDYVGIKSNLKSVNGPIITNVPGITTFRDQNGNLVTQVKKETANNDNGKNSQVVEFEETKQLPNGYSKSFKKEYSSSRVAEYQPTTFVQSPLNVEKYYNSDKLINGQQFSTFGQSSQNYQGSSVSGTSDYAGIKSNLKSTVGQSNVPEITTFRDQNGNLVTQVKKETVNNDNGQNSHVIEFEETKQHPNGYSKSFKKEYSSSSVSGSQSPTFIQNPVSYYPSLIKDTTTEVNTLFPQNFTFGQTGKLNGYNTFFNNQKYHLNSNGPINSQITNDKQLTDTGTSGHGLIKVNSFGYNTKDQTDCDDSENTSSSLNQGFQQQIVNVNTIPKSSSVIQTVNYPSTPKIPIGQNFEKTESYSTQTQEIGQQSVDLHGYLHSSPIGQQPVNIDSFYTPKKPSVQKFEKTESFSTQKQEEVGQQSVDLHGYLQPSSIGQQPVNIDNLYISKQPSGQKFEKIESSYQNKHNSVGQEQVIINDIEKSKHQSSLQPTSGQQVQGLEFLTSKYGDTTHLLDLGVNNNLGQQPSGQQIVEVYEGHRTLEKNIDLNSSDHLPINIDNYKESTNNNHQTLHEQSMESKALQGQQTVDFTGNFERPTPTYQKYGNGNIQTSQLSSSTGKLITGKDQPIKSTYNSVFDKLGQLEHEILGATSTVNINKDNFQTSYSTNHNVKSMPVQTSQQQESHFLKTINEDTQYIEPESEIVLGTNDQMFSSSSYVKESKSVVQKSIENQTSNNEHFPEEPTTQSSVWKKIGDKFKGTIQNAKSKAQQLASTINDKVGFLNENVTETPC